MISPKTSMALVFIAFLLAPFCLFLQRAEAKRNVILIQTDDQSRSALFSRYMDSRGKTRPTMSYLRGLLQKRGVDFQNYQVATPLCSPSRASLLTGRYSHNTGIVANSGANGGAEGWRASSSYSNHLAKRLQEGGYHTAHFGKWANGYGLDPAEGVPPGWDTWVGDMRNRPDATGREFYGYRQFLKIDRRGLYGPRGPFGNMYHQYDKGLDPKSCRPQISLMGRCFYHTDRISSLAADEINYASRNSLPFYLQLNYYAPHGDSLSPGGPQPATRHLRLAKKTPLPRGAANPNYNEDTDSLPVKPFLLREKNGPIVYPQFTRASWQNTLESLLALDEGIEYLVSLLKKRGQYDNTYIVFTSDNGYFYGDHRFTAAKFLAYEESSHVPLLIIGPGIKPSRSTFPASTVDVAPTVLELAQEGSGYQADGMSLAGELKNPTQDALISLDSSITKRAQIIEHISAREMQGLPDFEIVSPYPLDVKRAQGPAPALHYRALKIGRYKYIAYDKTEAELYDLAVDREELKNVADDPSYAAVVSFMKRQWSFYKNCQGSTCLQEVPGPLPAPLP